MSRIADTNFVTWFSRIFRWLVGLGFVTAGIMFYDKGGWPAIAFGALIFITGFLRPRRCMDDVCDVEDNQEKENSV